jgi:DNA excision repair protein ERCC-6
MKCDVDVKLPDKTEQVLFCPMTSEQREAYRAYLASREVEEILDGSREALGGIDVLRKIVNHPDLLERRAQAGNAEYGEAVRSGKLQVTLKILSLWREQGHRCLIFSQTQQMLDIIESAVAQTGYTYRRMDGNTSIAARMSLIDDFNDEDRGVFAFLLTTKVGWSRRQFDGRESCAFVRSRLEPFDGCASARTGVADRPEEGGDDIQTHHRGND